MRAAALGLAAGAFALWLSSCQRAGGPQVNLQRMDVQPRYQSYGAGRFFANGMAMQRPPAGTVAREDPIALTTAPAPDPALLELGRQQYQVACAACHGDGGYGGTIVALNLPDVPGFSLQSPQVRALAPAQLHARISLAGDIRHARATELSDRERWAVALYVRALIGGGARTDVARRDSTAAAEARRVRADMAADLMRLNGGAP